MSEIVPKIIQIVSDYYKIPTEDLKNNVHCHGGLQVYTKPTFIIWYFCEIHTRIKQKTNTGCKDHSVSLKKLAAIMGRKTHADVLHGIKAVRNQMDTNPSYRAEIYEISIIIDEKLFPELSAKNYLQYKMMSLC